MHGGNAGSERRSFVRGFDKFSSVANVGQRGHAWFQKLGDGFRLAEGQQQADFGVFQNGGLAGGVFFDAIGAKGRIDGDGNRAGEKNSGVRDKKFTRGGKHQRDAAACWDAAAGEFCGAALSGGIELAEG